MKVEDVLYESWEVFKKQWLVFLLGGAMTVIGSVFIITLPPLFFGLYYMVIKGLKGEEVEIVDLLRGFDYFVKSWVFFIVAFILIGIGFILLIIPGLVLYALFIYAIPLIILDDSGAIDGLKKSYRFGRENFQFTVLLFAVVIILSMIGGSGFGSLYVLWIFTTPFIALCVSSAAIKLNKLVEEKKEEVVEEKKEEEVIEEEEVVEEKEEEEVIEEKKEK